MARPYPVPNATIPYWRTELHELDSHRSTPELPQKQDIVIIGAGFAGAALAKYLLEDDSPSSSVKPSITILEAREACSGATGRNGGHLRPDLFVSLAARMQEAGLKAANSVALFEVANEKAVAALVAEENIACDLQQVTTADTFVDQAEAAKIKKLWDVMVRLDCPTLKEVMYHGPEDAERVTGVKDAKVAFTYPAHTVWPYKLVMHILAGAVRAGVNLQTHTPVYEVSGAPDGEGYWALSTSRGVVRAKKVVLATNAYTSGLLPEYDDAIYPARGTVCRVVPKTQAEVKLGSCAVEIQSPASVDCYYGTRPDGSLVIGGAKTTFNDRRNLWYRNYDDSTLIEPAVPYFPAWPGKALAGWEGKEVQMDRVWTGIMGYSADEAPHVGPVSSKPGLYICAGFNGHGMPNVLLCAKGLAKMIKEGCPFSQTGVPACYETGAERLRKISKRNAAPAINRARADIFLKHSYGS
ncbi:FAD dependent oxidoreductase [Annulohypoxylon truncatum]|uniref:FAD dependent oxidoreductase n=1 Tax=Annulohypoxylon truncatum TaxID=327061 RepID=UPI00200897DD|nr:FAD dependent oxidoreductase [Annulohypoxylon truncatum]KAI1214663.1 FAD dependent oxidoreductase [Annulohypoxylon truncatum]